MKKVVNMIFVLLILGLLVYTPVSSKANVEEVKQEQTLPLNRISVDMTIDPATGKMSVGGFSADQLQAMGINPLDPEIMSIVNQFDEAHIEVNGETITIDVNNEKLASFGWNTESRQSIFDLAGSYGISLNGAEDNTEKWLGDLDFEVTARLSSERSKPFQLELSTPVQAGVADNGQVSVEDMPLDLYLSDQVMRLAERGKIKNFTACVDKGTLSTVVNDKDLPEITVYPGGMRVLANALKVKVENTEPLFSSRFGLDVTMSDGEHSSLSCGD